MGIIASLIIMKVVFVILGLQAILAFSNGEVIQDIGKDKDFPFCELIFGSLSRGDKNLVCDEGRKFFKKLCYKTCTALHGKKRDGELENNLLMKLLLNYKKNAALE